MVVTSAFDSAKFRDSIDQLSREIVDDLSVEIQVMTAISATSTLLCVQEFIGTSFSQTMAVTLEKNVEKWLDEMTVNPEAETEVTDILIRRTPSLTGVSLILGTQIAGLLARKLGQQIVARIVTRIVGKVAGSLIPVAGWVIGGALLVWDLIQLPKGSIPQIRQALKKPDVKQKIRAQIVMVVEEELEAALPAFSETVTSDIYDQWKSFLQDFEHVLRLAERNEHFRTIVDGVTADQVDKLSELVSVGTEALGTKLLDRIIETGEFERILALPIITFGILRDTADPELVLAWADLAGEGIVSVVKTELYKFTSPSEIGDRETLEKVLALEDSLAIQFLMKLRVEHRRALLRLRTGQTKWLFSELSEDDLTWLLEYFSELQGQATEILVDFVKRDQVLISQLQGSDELRSRFPAVLNLAETSSKFQTILNGTAAGQADKLSKLVAVASEALEPEEFAALIDSGQFEEILALPQNSFEILRVTGNPALVLDWAELAGEALVEVVETGLYVVAAPDAFHGRADLERVLEIENPVAIQRLMNLDQNEREALLKLSPEEARATLLSDLSEDELGKALDLQDIEALKWVIQLNQDDRSFLLTSLSVAKVQWLVSFKADLADDATVLLAGFIDQYPALMSELAIEKIGQSFKESQNPEAVLTFVSARTGEPATLLPTIAMFTSASELISGDLPNALYLHYYLTQWLILLTALLVLTALSISGWRLFRRRQFPEIWDRIRRTKGGRP